MSNEISLPLLDRITSPSRSDANYAKRPIQTLTVPSPHGAAAKPLSKRSKRETISIQILGPDLEQEDRILPDAPSSYGMHVASYSFGCSIVDGGKNRRQAPSELLLILPPQEASVSATAEMQFLLPFKVYAESTLRRGKRELRRNVYVFRPRSDATVVISSHSSHPPPRQGCLKWTSDKVGEGDFLAFAAGVIYQVRVFGSMRYAEIQYSKRQHGEDLIGLINETSPETPVIQGLPPTPSKVADTFQSGHSIAKKGGWQILPTIWNLSLNQSESFYITLLKNDGIALPDEVKVRFVLSQEMQVDVEPIQIDMRERISFIVSAPRLFTPEKTSSATERGVRFMRTIPVQVISGPNHRIEWEGEFVYEIGFPVIASSNSHE